MIFKIITYSKWKRFWSRENTWLQSLFGSVLTAIQNIELPDGVATEANATANKEEILAAIPTECSDADIDHMFETTTEDGLIIVPSELITPEGTMPIGVFTAVTSLTPTE